MTNKEMKIAANAICSFLEEKQEDLRDKLMNMLIKNIDHLTNENVNKKIINDLKNIIDLIYKIDEYIDDEGSAVCDWIYLYYGLEENEK